MTKWAWSVLLALAFCPPAWAQTALPTSVSVDDPLDVLANFFVPAAPLEAYIGGEACDRQLRAKLTADPALVEIERALPGVIDRQVAATAAYCRREIHGWLKRGQDRVRSEWRASTSPADVKRLARMMATATNEALAIADRPGAVPRGPTNDENDRLRAAEAAMARTPGGVALINRVAAYQRKLAAENEVRGGSGYAEMTGILGAAMAEGRKAANAYAKDKGKPAIYQVDPPA